MNCKIIEDLLPLYAEGICSDESRAAVEAHIAGCVSCGEKLRLLKTDVPSPVAADDTGAGALKKVKRGILERSLLAASGLLLVIGLGLILAATLLYQSEVETLYLSVFLFLIPFMLFCISTLAGLSGKKKWDCCPRCSPYRWYSSAAGGSSRSRWGWRCWRPAGSGAAAYTDRCRGARSPVSANGSGSFSA
ncbi:MAG: zf-HC2 domain-containing protein [Clostridia bacterium]|nr:zf-HC2 domain-containing protein [Clostridia bacterium]